MCYTWLNQWLRLQKVSLNSYKVGEVTIQHYAKLTLALRAKGIPYDEIAVILQYVFELQEAYVVCVIRSVKG